MYGAGGPLGAWAESVGCGQEGLAAVAAREWAATRAAELLQALKESQLQASSWLASVPASVGWHQVGFFDVSFMDTIGPTDIGATKSSETRVLDFVLLKLSGI